MAVAQVVLLAIGSILAVVPWKRVPGWAGPAVVALVALSVRLVPFAAVRTATHDLTSAVLFLLLAVPLAVLLDRSGFFSAIAQRIDGGRHLRAALWVLAALVTIVFNLDAAVVLLTPLYVRIAQRHGEDPVAIGFIPALQAALASSVLPVSNLTNLIVADRLHLGAGQFIAHLGLPSVAAIAAGGWAFVRSVRGEPAAAADAATGEEYGLAVVSEPSRDAAADARAIRIGGIVVVWMLAGFIVGERVGVAAWVVVAIALVGLMAVQREVPWRQIPVHAAVLAAGLGVLATAAATHLPVRQLLSIAGLPGELATIGVLAIGANAINNLPALLVTLPAVSAHHERVWAVLIGVNLGPTLWVTGALSTLLWQSTMRRLGHTVTALQYARVGIRVGVPAIGAAVTAHLLIVVVGRV
ncbi:MAG: Citrate transporter [Ilumatobacteraceae bacterium]|nr:Citrate transporter [Ilumatobacteraceae bacterium]